MSLLLEALTNQQIELACKLIEQASLEVLAYQNGKGQTALHVSILQCAPEITELLLQKGSPVEAKTKEGLTPLHLAAKLGCLSCTELLVSYGADLHARCHQNRTPFYYANLKRHKALAMALHRIQQLKTTHLDQLMQFKLLEMKNSTKESQVMLGSLKRLGPFED